MTTLDTASTRIVTPGCAEPLKGEWALASVAPGTAGSPSDLDALAIPWLSCEGPMPAAASLRAAGLWDPEQPRDFDADDWWYRCRFTIGDPDSRLRLRFQGLATITDVFLNGRPIVHSESMFTARVVDVGHLLQHTNELLLHFHALAPLLRTRPPRPRWRTALVAHQQLRCIRTSLLGRMSTWWPRVAAVGPWRPVLIESASALSIERRDIRAIVDGHDGVVRVAIEVRRQSAAPIAGLLRVGDCTAPVECELRGRSVVLTATARVPHVERWWPHTHGLQPLYPMRLSIDLGNDVMELDLGHVGFRTIDVDRGPDGHGFGLTVNGVDVFCRGVCWAPLDVARLGADRADYRRALEQLRDAGMNMIRVPGTMVYETDDFYDLCDELGILVWQDVMFASMDYPSDDQPFTDAVTVEVRQFLEARQGGPSLAVCCGNSEVEQQAAMMRLPPAAWTNSTNSLFTSHLAGLVESAGTGCLWLPSTPTGGALPFQPDHGVSHYYGIGAYRRTLDDARLARVRFAAECLGFSNIPDAEDRKTAQGEPRFDGRVQRIPRDAGAEWDYEAVRDHYVDALFGVDSSTLREHDPERYRELGRVAVGEVMLRTFAEWRRPGSSCRGGLVWLARDFSEGAGWGIVDCTGRAKSSYWYLKRVLAPVALLAADEGLNGFWLHAINDTPDPIDAELRMSLYRDGCLDGEPGVRALVIPARSSCSVMADTLFGRFRDVNQAYQLGIRTHDVVAATLRDRARKTTLAVAHGFPGGLPAGRDSRLQLVARARPIAEGYAVTLEANRFAHAVTVRADGFVPDDNYLHLEPRQRRVLILRPVSQWQALVGSVAALNAAGEIPIVCEARHGQ